MLVPFLVVIELVRNLIRPLTLIVRLVANISSGHLIISLIRVGVGMRRVLIVALVLFLAFEICVRGVQAYVLNLLLVLFLKEVNYNH